MMELLVALDTINSAEQASSTGAKHRKGVLIPYFVTHYEGIKAEDDEDALVVRKGKKFTLNLNS
jgi:hypothetical protein